MFQGMPLGDVIKRRRKELNLTQAELGEGICEAMTISRLEAGKQMPTLRNVSAILERLNLPTSRYFAFYSKDEQQYYSLKRKIMHLNSKFHQSMDTEQQLAYRQQALQAHKDLEAILGPDDKFTSQFLTLSQVMLGREDGPYPLEESIQMLLDAIRLTCPSFQMDNIGSTPYTSDEIRLINQLAVVNDRKGNYQAGAAILAPLYQYLRRYAQDLPVNQSHFPIIAMNYAARLDGFGQYQQAIAVAEEAYHLCLRDSCLNSADGLLEVQAECLHFLGRETESIDYYYQSYHLCKILRHEKDMHQDMYEMQLYHNLSV